MNLCGQTEQFGTGSPSYKLHTNSPTWLVRDVPDGFTREQFEDVIATCFQRWAEVCNLSPQKHSNSKTTPTETIIVYDLGGRTPQGGQVLADQEMPTKQNLRMRINSRVRFIVSDDPNPSGIDIVRTLTHEIGHMLGLLHFPSGSPAELMEPSIGRIIEPQPTEAAFAVSLYGKPVASLPGSPTGRPKIDVEMTDANGVRWAAAGEMRRLG